MEEQFTAALRFVLGMTCALIRLNVGVVQENFIILHPREGVIKIRRAGPDGFNFGSSQFDSGLYLFGDLIVVERTAIGNDIGGHSLLPAKGPRTLAPGSG